MLYSGTDVLKVAEDERTAIAANNLSVQVPLQNDDESPVAILDQVQFELPSANMMAIMVDSGSGKTTLLNVLAQRTSHLAKLQYSGLLHYMCPSKSTSIFIAQILQEDQFLRGLTLQTLRYQAQLRPHASARQQHDEIISTLLELLDLDHHRDEMVRSFTGQSRLSGGEQRRASLAIQLRNNKQVLFLDEFMSGLDKSLSDHPVRVWRGNNPVEERVPRRGTRALPAPHTRLPPAKPFTAVP